VNSLDQVFADPQVQARDMKISMPYGGSRDGKVDLIGNPIKFSKTPVEYRFAPPRAGQDSDAVLEELLDLGPEERARLREKGII
jgi:crotonobetainyl-CoA:carnitine CoA-transferase CaiB-like acyl-CoA transferase